MLLTAASNLVTLFSFWVQVAVGLIVAVLVPWPLYSVVGVQVTVIVLVTVPEVRAGPTVDPLLVAVSTPFEEFIALNPFCTVANE